MNWGALFGVGLLLVGCGRLGFGGVDASVDGDLDAPSDAAEDGAEDDAGERDAELDAPEPDAPALDASDAAMDAMDAIDALDASDEGTDSDAAITPPSETVVARFPWNGYMTGSPGVTASLQPTFMWEPVPDAVRYEVQLDDSCFAPSTCAFPSVEMVGVASGTTFVPTPLPVSLTAPVGRRYTWRVRACNDGGCAGWSTPRYVDVGRAPGDLNGDGYGDIAGGAPTYADVTGGQGAVFVFYGGASFVTADPSFEIDDPDGASDGEFGVAVAHAGDVNGDGYGDLVAGAYFAGSTAGRRDGKAFVYYGGPAGVAAAPSVRLLNPAATANGFFGAAVGGVGDVNGDGYGDVVVGAYGQRIAYLYDGGSGGLPTTPGRVLPAPVPGAVFFASALSSAGDVNGDGFVDFVIGAIQPTGGAAYVWLGASSGVAAAPTFTRNNPDSMTGGTFGRAVSGGGDLDGDGFADFAVGADDQSNPERSEGAAYVYRGSRSGPSATPDFSLDNPSDSANGRFGNDVALVGDIDADGYDDLLVGAYLQGGGEAYVYWGAPAGSFDIESPTLLAPEVFAAYFGFAVSTTADVDGDGRADLVVSANGASNPTSQEGTALVFAGATDRTLVPRTTLDPADQVDALFGSSIAQ